MQFAVRSKPASRPTVVGSTPTAAGNALIDSGSTLIGPRDSLAKLKILDEEGSENSRKQSSLWASALVDRSCIAITQLYTYK